MPDIIIVEDNREIGTLLCDFLRKRKLYGEPCGHRGEGTSDL